MSLPPPGGQDPYQPSSPDESNPYAQPAPPPPPYQAPYGPPFPQQPVSQGNNGLAIASMATGIASIVLCFCCALIPVLAGGTALALGLVSLKQIKESGQGGRGMAIAGIATGAVGVAIGVVWLIISGFQIASGGLFNTDWRQ